MLLRLPYLLIQSLARRSNRKTQLASGCFFNPSLKLSRQAHHLPAPQISRVSGRPCAVGTVVLRSGYRRRPRRIHRGINSDSSLEMQTKPLLSKGSRKPNASDLVVRHPHSHLRDRVSPRLVLSGCTLHPPATRLRPTRRYSPPIPASVLWLQTPPTLPARSLSLSASASASQRRPEAGARALPLATSPARGARGEDCSARPRPHRKPLSFRHRTRARPRSRVGSDPSLAKKDKTWQCY